ncbi:MAG: hypothetical protein ACOX4I_09140 [Anaerovoracaceae bacterium]|jgi:hypothetical protein
MKILAKPIKTIVVFEPADRPPIPYKFKIEGEHGDVETIRIDKILYCHRERIAGVESIVYECQSAIGGKEKRYELKYLLSKCQWQLYKM